MSTIAKVAERAGVSRTTVSHVINHADRVSGHLRQRVEAAIAELGYSPNPQAQSLRTGRTNMVALLIPDIRNPFYSELVATCQADLEALGLDTMIFNSDVPGGHPHETNRHILRQVRDRRLDGLIIGDFALHGMHDELLDIELPAVFIGQLPNKAVDSIRADDFGGGYAMGAHLAAIGCRRIAVCTGPSFFDEAMARADGLVRAVEDAHLRFDQALRYEGTYLAPSGAEAVAYFMSLPIAQRPDAIFFSNYLMAMGGLAAIADRGLRVPDDLVVTVFGDLPPMDYVRPRLTRVGVSPSVLAHRSVAMLAERLSGAVDGAPRHEVVPAVLKVCDSA